MFTDAGINEALRPVASYEDRIHGLPYMMEARMFAFHKEIFAERGITDTPAPSRAARARQGAAGR